MFSSLSNFFRWARPATVEVYASNVDSCKTMEECEMCKEWVTEDDMYKRKRRGKVLWSKYCKVCTKRQKELNRRMIKSIC